MKTLLNHGAWLGLALLPAYLLEANGADGPSFLSLFLYYAVTYFGLSWAGRLHRDEVLGGEMTYAQGVSYCFSVGFFAGILVAMYRYVDVLFFDASIIQETMDASKILLAERTDEATLEEMMIEMEEVLTPFWIAMAELIGTSFRGFFLSLLIAVFLKRKQNISTLNE